MYDLRHNDYRPVRGVAFVVAMLLASSASADFCAPTSCEIETHCETLYAPATTIALTDDLISIWKAPKNRGAHFWKIWCETDVGTVTMNLQKDNGSPVDMATDDLACTTTIKSACDAGYDTCTSTFVAGENLIAAGDRIDLDIVSVLTSPTELHICWDYTYD